MPRPPPIQTTISPMRTRRQQLRLPDEVRYIQRRVAAHDGRMFTIGQFVPFSTETGDAPSNILKFHIFLARTLGGGF